MEGLKYAAVLLPVGVNEYFQIKSQPHRALLQILAITTITGEICSLSVCDCFYLPNTTKRKQVLSAVTMTFPIDDVVLNPKKKNLYKHDREEKGQITEGLKAKKESVLKPPN